MPEKADREKNELAIRGGSDGEVLPSLLEESQAEAERSAGLEAGAGAGTRPGMWQLAFPSILGNLSYTLVGMVQTKFIGELGPRRWPR